MKERPILFSGPMVRAILEGRKTQTRRVVKPQPDFLQYHEWKGRIVRDCESRGWCWKGHDFGDGDAINARPGYEMHNLCPHGKPCDRLWVRETHVFETNYGSDIADSKPPFNDGRPIQWDGGDPHGEKIYWMQAHYAATDPLPELVNEDCPFERCSNNGSCQHWRPSIFMPRWASRITLEITSVRVEMVQEISKSDCISEGMADLEDIHSGWHQSYAQLWDSINAKSGHGWDKNPWVWVVEFKRIA